MKSRNLIQLVTIPKIKDDALLFFAQSPDHIPFKIRRIYYITSPVKGLPRGKHAHRKTRQILFCISGSVRMVLDNGVVRETKTLSDPSKGIMLENLIWHEMLEMDKNTILLVLASEKYDKGDYIRDYGDFLKIVGKRNKT